MTKIQDHVIHDGDQDKTSTIDKKTPVPESIPSHIGPSEEALEKADIVYGRLTPNAVSPMKPLWRRSKGMDILLLSARKLVHPVSMGDPFRKILKHK